MSIRAFDINFQYIIAFLHSMLTKGENNEAEWLNVFLYVLETSDVLISLFGLPSVRFSGQYFPSAAV